MENRKETLPALSLFFKNLARSFGYSVMACSCVFLLQTKPILADPPAKKAAIEFGFCKDLTDQLPAKHLPRARSRLIENQPTINPLSDKKFHEEARDLLTPRLYQKAEPSSLIPTLLKLFQQQPNSPKLSRKLALTCLQAGQPREALYWFTKTFQLDRSDLSALWNMATLSYRLGDFPAAYGYLGEYARQDPYSAWGRIAKQFQQTGKFGGYEMSSSFDQTNPRIGMVASGTSGSGGSLMVIDGQPTTLEEYIPVTVQPSARSAAIKKATPEAEKSERKLAESPSRPFNHSINKVVIDKMTVASPEPVPAPTAVSPSVPQTPGPVAVPASAPANVAAPVVAPPGK